MELSSLPPLVEPGRYQCVFGKNNYVKAVFEAPRTILCELPPYNVRPRVLGDNGVFFLEVVFLRIMFV